MKAKKIKRIKGMTLVEVLVAMTILGLGGVMLCAGFGQVNRMNAENYDFNKRMSEQIKIAENNTDKNPDGCTEDEKVINEPVAGDVTITVEGGGNYTISGKSVWVIMGKEYDKVDVDFKYFIPD